MAEAKNTKPRVSVPTDSESVISMVLGGMVVLVIGALLFSYIRDWRQNRNQTTQETAQETNESEPIIVEELPTEVTTEPDETGREVPTNLPAKYTVKEGDSTWQIAEAFYGSGFNYLDIEEANELQPMQELVPGMELTIPKVSVRSADEAGVPRAELTERTSDIPENNDGTGHTKGDDSQAQEALESEESTMEETN